MKKLYVVLLGVALGIIAANFLFVGSWLSLIIWGIVAIVLGYQSQDRKNALLSGAWYGYFLVVAFVIAGYRGDQTLIGWSKVIVFSLIFGFIGAALAAIGAAAGYFLKQKIRPQP